MDRPRCSKRVYKPGRHNWGGSQCKKSATVQADDGNWYCAVHDPVASKKRRDEAYERLIRKSEQESIRKRRDWRRIAAFSHEGDATKARQILCEYVDGLTSPGDALPCVVEALELLEAVQ